jgi:hypothetical protein
MIRIRTKPGLEGKRHTGVGTEFRLADGTPVPGISDCTIRITHDDAVMAVLRINVAAVDIEAHPLLDLQTVQEAAAYYGYQLITAGDAA